MSAFVQVHRHEERVQKRSVLLDRRFLQDGHMGSGSSFLVFDSSAGVELLDDVALGVYMVNFTGIRCFKEMECELLDVPPRHIVLAVSIWASASSSVSGVCPVFPFAPCPLALVVCLGKSGNEVVLQRSNSRRGE